MNFRDGITPSSTACAAPCPNAEKAPHDPSRPPRPPSPSPLPPAAPTFNFSTFQPFNFSTAPKARPPPAQSASSPPTLPFSNDWKKVSNGWKKRPDFSNDWKNLSPLFQRLEKIFRAPTPAPRPLRPPSPIRPICPIRPISAPAVFNPPPATVPMPRPSLASSKTFPVNVRFPLTASDIRIEGVVSPCPSHPSLPNPITLPPHAMKPASHLLAEGASFPVAACKRFSLAPVSGGRATVASIGPQGPVTLEPRAFLPMENGQNFPSAKKHTRQFAPLGRAFGLLSSPGAWPCLHWRAPEARFFFPPRFRAIYPGKERQVTATQPISKVLPPISMPKTPPGRNRGTFRFPTWRKWDMKHLSTVRVPSGPQTRGRHLPSRSDKALHEEKRPNVARKGYGFKLEKRLSERALRRVFGMFLFQGAWPCLLHGTSTRRVFPFSSALRISRHHPEKGESRKGA